jgi:leucyl/phenylalanyl-tRNA---protein transferase
VQLLTPDLLVYAYRNGVFPMADVAREGGVSWFAPDPRALIPLDDRFRISKSLRRVLRSAPFRITVDEAFGEVIRACAAPAPGRETTWISREIVAAYEQLHAKGIAHSVECWAGPRLAGGLYGVAIGSAFFGESMFSRETDASKVALVHLVERLRAGGFVLLDTQFMTDHLARFGAFTVPRAEYEARLAEAVGRPAHWAAIDQDLRQRGGPAGGGGVK